ncbi:replication-relaxation family protein [Thermoactinomyces sp. FSL K6-2592]|jgi:hypothetical protein|uniref:replication-relaxation family protein n=1 Tax=Thermoactinomyces sp. FSL K6-2592 TaxID=2975347 RepID=UPI0030F69E35
MITRWINHTGLNPVERLMMVMFELGMATLEDLSIVMGYKQERVYRLYQQIQNLGKPEIDRLKSQFKEIEEARIPQEEKKERIKILKKKIQEEKRQWAKPHRRVSEQRGSKARMYSLGPKGVKYCRSLMNEQGYWDIKSGQIDHYYGLNKILIRTIQTFGTERLGWYSSYEATDILISAWELLRKKEWEQNQQLARLEKRQMIRPDALLILDNVSYWVEFDNNTERSRQLIQKYQGYQRAIAHYEETQEVNHPVLWVTTNQYRRDEMERIWELVKKDYSRVPKMHFFVQGQETDWLKRRHPLRRMDS